MELFRSGLVITDLQNARIVEAMGKLGERISARYLLLVDSTGQQVADWGAKKPQDPVGLGALVASDMLATMEMARLTGQGDGYEAVMREGRESNAFLNQIGSALVLLTLVSREMPSGWVRLLIQQATEDLAEIVRDQDIDPSAHQAWGDSGELSLDQQDLEAFFAAEIDEMWTE